MQLHHAWFLFNKSHIYFLHPLHHLSFLIFVFFFPFYLSDISIPVLYLGSISFTFHLSLLTCHFFPLELSLHTIANNLVRESHLCSHAFSVNSRFSPSPHCWSFLFRFLTVTLSVTLDAERNDLCVLKLFFLKVV